jgi:hypothetical protein
MERELQAMEEPRVEGQIIKPNVDSRANEPVTWEPGLDKALHLSGVWRI